MKLFKQFLLKHPILLKSVMSLVAKKNYATLAIVRHLKRNSIVYDVGANVGAFSSNFAVIVGRNGRVFCFEPVSSNFEKLKKVQQSFPWIMPYHLIVSDTNGEAEICIPGDDAAQSSLHELDWGNWKAAETIKKETRPCVTLDNFISTEQTPPPHFLKIDTEGAECQVLKGAANTLENHGPKVYVEMNTETLRGFGAKPSDLLNQLKGYGYNRFEAVTHNGVLRNITDADKVCEDYFSPDLIGWKA